MSSEWVLVPREPTEAMRAAGSVAMDARHAREWSVWSAMLTASPSPDRAESVGLPSREEIARVIEPNSWKALGTGLGDSMAHENRRTSSLRKADAILALPEGGRADG
jgi:hypothetical protein